MGKRKDKTIEQKLPFILTPQRVLKITNFEFEYFLFTKV